MSRKSDARERIIETARDLFWKQGFESTGISEILDEAGIGSGSLYWFFSSKEEILIAILEQYINLLDTMIVTPAFQKSDDPIDRIFHILNVYRDILIEHDFKLGCPIGNIVLELSDRFEKVRLMAIKNFKKWRSVIINCLKNASDRLSPNIDFNSVSIFILTTMEGAMMQARAHKDVSYFDISIAQLKIYIDSLLLN